MREAAVASLTVLALILAGCSGADETLQDTPVQTDPVTAADGRDLRTELLANDTLETPQWNVGDWWGHHIFFGSEDNEGTHINTVVVEDRGDTWYLASDEREAAKLEAAWDIPMLGDIDKETLATTAFAGDWNLFEFPLFDGKTWETNVDPVFSGTRSISFTATYNGAIETPYGKRPGFDIIGLNATGDVEVITDFVPDIGWYSRLTLLDAATTDPDDFVIHINSMGFGNNWTGTYVTAESETLVNDFQYFTPFDATGSKPPQHKSVSLSGGDEVYGVVFLVASGGNSFFRLTDPDGNTETWEVDHLQLDPDQSGNQIFDFVEKESQDGDWTWQRGGAGAFAGQFLWIHHITYTETPFSS